MELNLSLIQGLYVVYFIMQAFRLTVPPELSNMRKNPIVAYFFYFKMVTTLEPDAASTRSPVYQLIATSCKAGSK